MRRMTVVQLILVWCVAGPTRAVEFAGGTGEPNDPYQIATAEQLNEIGASPQWWDKHFRLIEDIDLSAYRGTDFHPLGYWRSDKDNMPFTGVFDGGGHCISSFQWRCLDGSYVGLFGYVSGPNAAIRNLTLVDARVNVREGSNVACLVGFLRGGTLAACSTRECEVVVQAGTNVGSLAGWVQDVNSFDCVVHDDVVQVAKGSCIGSMAGNIQTSRFERCRVEGATIWSVEGTEIGGLAGRFHGRTLTDCHATADVAGAASVGGLAGACRGVVTDCSAEGTVQGNTCVGGLMGKDLSGGSRGGPAIVSKIARCFAETGVVGGSSVGGLLGSNSYMSIESCYAAGSVTGGDLVGGLVGKNDAAIVNCYATGSVTGTNLGSVGGLVGRNDRTITNCYSVGNVPIGRGGGVVGRCENPRDVVACFWDLQTSGQTVSEGGLGKTTTQMHLANTFLVWATGGNEGIWTIDDGVDYPRLWWEKRPGEAIRMASLSGTGAADDPYLIYTAEEFNRVGAMAPDLGKCFKLMMDIDLADFNEVVLNLIGSKAVPFRGVFDGNGHSIAHFNYVARTAENVGLFGVVSDPNARIMNLRLIDPNVSVQTGTATGGMVGLLAQGTLWNCHVEGGRVSGNLCVGGLVGEAGIGALTDCFASTTVSGGRSVGGLAGYSSGDTVRCGCDCRVTGARDVGGLVGANDGGVSGCYAAGSVSSNSGASSLCVGGLIGSNSGAVVDSYATAETAGHENVAGFVGYNAADGTIRNCYCVGAVAGDIAAGGLVARNDGDVVECFWDVDATGQARSAGGMGKTSGEMRAAETFLLWGACGHGGVWTVDDGNGCPRLSWEGMPGQVVEAVGLSELLAGVGSPDDPYRIRTAEELRLIGRFSCDWDKHFVLETDIDLSALGDTPFNLIGSGEAPFTGVFDGAGHTIAGFVLVRSELHQHNAGLFGRVEGLNATIQDLHLAAPVVEAADGGQVGTLVGYLRQGTVIRCYCENGFVTGGSSVGGLVGLNSYGLIKHCSARCTVVGRSLVGGLVGDHTGTVRNCAAEGEVSGQDFVGGLAGRCRVAEVRDSHAIGDVNGIEAIGGLVGANRSSAIVGCSSGSSVRGMLDVGGLVGINDDALVSDCYATGSVAWVKPPSRVLWDLYDGKVPGEIAVGGFAGRNGAPDSPYYEEGEIVRCYCTGRVSGHAQAAGFVGRQQPNSTTVASFWDMETTGQSLSVGGEGRSTADMQNQETFTAVGWDFLDQPDRPHDVWTMPEGGYPLLASQLPEGAGLPAFSGGSGEPNDPYLVSTAGQLNSIGYNPRLMDDHFRLLDDIDLAGVEFFSIGCEAFPFAGVFDGGGHTISNLGRIAGRPMDVGLFGRVSGHGTIIRDLGLIDPNLQAASADTVGSLVGWLGQATVADCFVAGGRLTSSNYGITPMGYLGGLVGYVYEGGAILRCWSNTEVVGKGYGDVGGLVGCIYWGSVASSCSKSAVTGESGVGGLAGWNRSEIVDCYAEGRVQGQQYVGGLLGLNQDLGRVTNCYARAIVVGQQKTGGLLGSRPERQPLNCFWDMQASGQATSPAGTGKTTAEMQMAATFSDAGWDFENTWTICEGRDYPRLRWESAECEGGL